MNIPPPEPDLQPIDILLLIAVLGIIGMVCGLA